MELFGRERELALVADALDAVRSGGRQALAVVGEAGIGKSALLDSIAARAAPLRVLRGRAAEHECEVPFALAVDAFDAPAAALAGGRLEALGGALGSVLPAAGGNAPVSAAGPAERLRVHREFAGLLGQLARQRPVVVLLDDVQWADEASLELLGHLVRRPPAAPHLLVFAARPGALLPEAELLVLEPLDHDASLAMVGPDGEAIARAGGGNPLFLRELARAPGGGLPRTLLAAVQLETAGLDGPPGRLLAGAAVAGDPFDPELAAAAAGAPLDAAALDELVASQLVRPAGPGRAFAFRHPLVHRAVYDGLAPAWRLGAHERAAAALAARGAGAAARAHHVERCARVGDAAAIAVLRQAAARAAPTAPATAARWYASALRLLGDDPTERAALLAPTGSALAAAGRFAEAHDALLEAHGGAPSLGLATACAQVETQLGRYDDARRRLLRVLADAPRERRAAVSFELAVVAYHQGNPDELGTWSEPAIEDAASDPLLHAGALALGALAAVWTDRPDRALPLLDRATARLAAVADETLAQRPDAALHVTTAQLLCERYAAADASASRTLAATSRSGQGQLAVPLRLTRAMARLQRGALEGALADAETGEELARLQGVPRLLHFALWIRALVHHERGEPYEADRAATECAALTLEPDKLVRSGTCTVAAIGADDDPERAIEAIISASGETVEIADRAWSAWLLLRLVRAALTAGDHARAERWARIAAERATLPAGAARAQIAQAELALTRHQPRDAAALAAAAERTGAALDALDARLLGARALAAAGESDAARTALQRVAADAARIGALRLRDAAARELRALGAHLDNTARRAAGGQLTEREHEIAMLVAHGRSNQQVAATLYLSQKTVANALTRVYAKLGIHSRSQLARLSVAPRAAAPAHRRSPS